MSGQDSDLSSLTSTAKDVIRRLSSISHEKYSFSTASCEPYNTAWVAMVTKTSPNGQKEWLFPECFYNLLKTQNKDGCWAYHPQTKTTGVLATAACLLALLKHSKEPLQVEDVSVEELRKRIALATRSLRVQLQDWDDVQTSNHIGVELITPALLAYLEEENGLLFQFPAQTALQEMYTAKMSRFKPEYLYQNKVSTAAHSLEAFIGKIDFDRVSGHLYHGSMMASPSATAVYLMHATVWDDEAEGFLRHIIKAGAGHGDGGIPGTFPTSYFEYSWTVVTLLQAGFSTEDLGTKELGIIADHLEAGFKEEGGIIGFAPRAPDADDTAKGLIALNLMGRQASPEQMIKVFEGRDHFTTFGSERDPSLTSNCHVLLALLQCADLVRYDPQIIKTTKFICDYWFLQEGRIRDKWHLSHLYPTMLLVKAFTELLSRLSNSAALETSQQLLWRVLVCLFQACLHTLSEQEEDGSWGGLPEQTSYAILTLAEAQKCSFFNGPAIASRIQASISRGVRFLETREVGPGDHSWISKAAYRVAFVAEAYELAARNVAHLKRKVTIGADIVMPLSGLEFETYIKIFQETPLFSSTPEWQLRAWLLESSVFLPLLWGDESGIAEHKLLDIQVFALVSCARMGSCFISTSRLYEKMLSSMHSLQANKSKDASAGVSKLCDFLDTDFKGMIQTQKALEADLDSNANINGNGVSETPDKFHGGMGNFLVHVLNQSLVTAAFAVSLLFA
ncbi:hypothetical protein MCOR25_010650 [Pyricularia grisea]|nr:hypothetical protein MCOR25_010650 [Pyricularia grisea]